MNDDLIICYLKPLSENEIISINKYWTLKDASKDEFKYTVKQIDSQRAPGCCSVSSLTQKATCLVHNSSFICNDCKQLKPVKNRNEFTERLRLSSFQCRECKEKELTALREESIEILRNFLDRLLNKVDYFSELTYIDKLILLAILSNDYQESKPIFTSDTRINITGSENVDMPALSRLVSLGALVKIADLPEEVRLAETIAYGPSVAVVYKKDRNGVRQQRNQYAIEKGIYFSLPIGFNNYSEFIKKIYDDIVTGGIEIQEVTELKRLVIDMRVENFYRLIEHVSQEFNLEIYNSVPLGALLSHLSERYPITKCYYTFYHFAKEVILYIHRNRPDSYSRPHLFTKFVSNYIQDVEEKGWELKFSRKLPESIFTSNLEALVSRNFIDGHFNWHSLTAAEVIERWLSKISIRDSLADIADIPSTIP